MLTQTRISIRGGQLVAEVLVLLTRWALPKMAAIEVQYRVGATMINARPVVVWYLLFCPENTQWLTPINVEQEDDILARCSGPRVHIAYQPITQ